MKEEQIYFLQKLKKDYLSRFRPYFSIYLLHDVFYFYILLNMNIHRANKSE